MTDIPYEQRTATRQRREEDRGKCPVHDLLQAATSEHRANILRQLGLKADKEVVDTHLKSVTRTIGILITVGCLLVAGIMGTTLTWLRHDIEISDAKMVSAISSIHQRITTNADVRTDNDTKQTIELQKIANKLDTLDSRLGAMERVHNDGSKGSRRSTY